MTENQKLREALQELHDVFCEDDHSKAGRHRARLALIQTRKALATTEPTSKQSLQVDPAVNQQLTTEPVDEREAFEKWLGIKPCGAAHDFGWAAWQARAAMAQGVK